MGWQGASWHLPAQTHTCKCTHTCAIYTTCHIHTHWWTHPHAHTHTCTHVLAHLQPFTLAHTPAHTCVHKRISAYEVFGETEGKGEGGMKVCRGRNPNVFHSLIWAFSACFIRSALSAGIWGPRCEHWVYKCFVLFICLPSKPEEATGGEWKWGKRKNEKILLQERWGRNISVRCWNGESIVQHQHGLNKWHIFVHDTNSIMCTVAKQIYIKICILESCWCVYTTMSIITM